MRKEKWKAFADELCRLLAKYGVEIREDSGCGVWVTGEYTNDPPFPFQVCLKEHRLDGYTLDLHMGKFDMSLPGEWGFFIRSEICNR